MFLHTIDYKCSGVNGEIYYLSVSHNSRPSIDAKVLNLVTKCIQNGIHRKDFYIFYAYDETSEYYCAKLAPRFGKFERLMREFIYVNLTISLKSQWFEQSFTEDLKNEIKAKLNSQNSLIEQALYEMTFAQLYDFLFVEYAYNSPDYIIYEKLLPLDLENTDKKPYLMQFILVKKLVYGIVTSNLPKWIYRIIFLICENTVIKWLTINLLLLRTMISAQKI